MPITDAFLPELGRLVELMNSYDVETKSPWEEHNHRVREALLYAAHRRLTGSKPQHLNMFEPGSVAPALAGPEDEIGRVIAGLVESNGDTRIPGQ